MFPFEQWYPARQEGASEGAEVEIEFQCCTDSRSGSYPGNPVCPDATRGSSWKFSAGGRGAGRKWKDRLGGEVAFSHVYLTFIASMAVS